MTKQQLEKITRAMLLNAAETRKQIAESSGVNFEFLKKFAHDYNEDYGIRKVQKLHDYLIQKGKTKK